MAEIEPPKDKAERDARLDAVMAAIEANPQHWDQSALWHCKTSHCFAGFAQCLAISLPVDISAPTFYAEGGLYVNWNGEQRRPPDDAVEWLGIDGVEDASWRDLAEELFNADNSLDDLRRIVSEIKELPYEAAP